MSKKPNYHDVSFMADNGFAAMLSRWDREEVRVNFLGPLRERINIIQEEEPYEHYE